jgi:hypothetical protein
MKTECIEHQFTFQGLNRRNVEANFNGGSITSDAGGLLLRETEKRVGVIEQFTQCFTDYRSATLIEHSVEELVGQRIYGLALGYEDLSDHDDLRHDPLLATLAGKEDPTGANRIHERDRGKALAGKSTLNRLELTPADANVDSRYKKIVADEDKIERFFVELFLQQHPKEPGRIVIDLDATDDLIHGNQEGRFFHGYYDHYCYLPLYMFCGHHLLSAKLRTSDVDAAKGSVEELKRVIGQLREEWPEVQIIIRGDSGFCREEIMAWCEENDVDYLLGLARNSRLVGILQEDLDEVRRAFELSGRAVRLYKDFQYRTKKSWSRERRVVGKAEHLAKGSNPRYVVTSIPADKMDARTVYQKEYCARGDMENRIKEQQLGLFADRTSTHWMRSNQLRLWFSSVAYVLMNALRSLGLKGTAMARAQCWTIREKLFKIGACVKISVRRVFLSLSSSYPYKGTFTSIYRNLRALVPRAT